MSTNTTVSNLQTVIAIYEAFGKGDIPAILDNLTEKAVFEHQGNPVIMPFAGAFKGKSEIWQFFQKVGENFEFSEFRPENFREEGNRVINDVYMESKAVPTGKFMNATVTFYWTFNAEGKVIHWKNEGGLEVLEAAFQQ